MFCAVRFLLTCFVKDFMNNTLCVCAHMYSSILDSLQYHFFKNILQDNYFFPDQSLLLN